MLKSTSYPPVSTEVIHTCSVKLPTSMYSWSAQPSSSPSALPFLAWPPPRGQLPFPRLPLSRIRTSTATQLHSATPPLLNLLTKPPSKSFDLVAAVMRSVVSPESHCRACRIPQWCSMVQRNAARAASHSTTYSSATGITRQSPPSSPRWHALRA
jgi:hypothetical protein